MAQPRCDSMSPLLIYQKCVLSCEGCVEEKVKNSPISTLIWLLLLEDFGARSNPIAA